MLNTITLLLLLCAAGADDYFMLPGRWVGDDRNMTQGTAPSTAGRRYLPLDTDFSLDGWIADDIMLQICDGRKDCDMIYSHPVHTNRGGPDSLVEFLRRDGHATSYVHRERCASGRTATRVMAASGGAYKACNGSWDYPQPLATLNATRGGCAKACDVRSDCTMFSIKDGTCWLAGFNMWDGGALYIKVPVPVPGEL
eukprot:g4906.t1